MLDFDVYCIRNENEKSAAVIRIKKIPVADAAVKEFRACEILNVDVHAKTIGNVTRPGGIRDISLARIFSPKESHADYTREINIERSGQISCHSLKNKLKQIKVKNLALFF